MPSTGKDYTLSTEQLKELKVRFCSMTNAAQQSLKAKFLETLASAIKTHGMGGSRNSWRIMYSRRRFHKRRRTRLRGENSVHLLRLIALRATPLLFFFSIFIMAVLPTPTANRNLWANPALDLAPRDAARGPPGAGEDRRPNSMQQEIDSSARIKSEAFFRPSFLLSYVNCVDFFPENLSSQSSASLSHHHHFHFNLSATRRKRGSRCPQRGWRNN